MSGQWEKYVDDATRAFCVERWGEGLTDQADPDDIEFYRQGVAAAVAAVGPLIAEDTRERMVAAAGRAVERERNPVVGTTDPFVSLEQTLAFSSNDWGSASDFAWLYGIVLGWDTDEPGEESSMPDVAAKHEWSDRQVERLRQLHRDFKAAAAAYQCQPPQVAS